MKLLIVEDNSGVRHLIRSLVASVADEIYECADGGEALALYTNQHPDFVLMDIEMKVVDGITATGRIRKFNPSARIIMVTDHDEPDLREMARLAGACGYVVKENLLKLIDLLTALESA
jgi:CheY-like chemotaxis protein